MKTSHIVIGAFMLWSASFANICLAQESAMGDPLLQRIAHKLRQSSSWSN